MITPEKNKESPQKLKQNLESYCEEEEYEGTSNKGNIRQYFKNLNNKVEKALNEIKEAGLIIDKITKKKGESIIYEGS